MTRPRGRWRPGPDRRAPTEAPVLRRGAATRGWGAPRGRRRTASGVDVAGYDGGMILACYDTGSRHLGEVLLDATGDRPRCIRAVHVDVTLTDEVLAAIARAVVATWVEHGVERVVVERISGVGAGDGESVAAVRARGSHAVGAGKIEGLIRGLAAGRGIPVVGYTAQTVRAGLKITREQRAAYVRERIDGWPEDTPDGARSGQWYMHRYDAAIVGLYDIEYRKAPKQIRKARSTKPVGRPRKHGTKYMRRNHPSDAAFELMLKARCDMQ